MNIYRNLFVQADSMERMFIRKQCIERENAIELFKFKWKVLTKSAYLVPEAS